MNVQQGLKLKLYLILMSKFKAIIVDDEQDARENLRSFIDQNHPEIELVGEANSASSAYDLFNEKEPDLVFLDIEMPGGNGFEFLKMFDQEIQFDVIFTTAYGHYALQAIKFSAIDYILKPLDPDEIREAVRRFVHKQTLMSNRGSDQIETLIYNLNQQSSIEAKLVIPEVSGFSIHAVSSIIYLQGEGNYTTIIMDEQKKVTSSKTLAHYDDLLKSHGFLYRVSRSCIINLNKMERFSSKEGNVIILKDKHEVDLPRRKKQEFLDLLKNLT